jgi:hypothetical protein
MAATSQNPPAPWPELPPLADWPDTLDTVHLWAQIVGTIRLERGPWINHAWGSARGQSQLRPAFEFTYSLCMPQPEILMARAHEKFDDEGRRTDGKTRSFLGKYLVAFQEWTTRLSGNRR